MQKGGPWPLCPHFWPHALGLAHAQPRSAPGPRTALLTTQQYSNTEVMVFMVIVLSVAFGYRSLSKSLISFMNNSKDK